MKQNSARGSVPGRILLVDDNEMGLRARKVVLEEQGHEVVPCGGGAEALNEYSSRPFDLVITDYRMPLLNGIQLIARLRESTPELPIVLISGVAEALGLDESNTGADAVVQKNCHEVTALTRVVARLLSRKPPRKPARVQGAPAARAAAAGR
jgi:CheY-like chemotaxis protein